MKEQDKVKGKTEDSISRIDPEEIKRKLQRNYIDPPETTRIVRGYSISSSSGTTTSSSETSVSFGESSGVGESTSESHAAGYSDGVIPFPEQIREEEGSYIKFESLEEKEKRKDKSKSKE